eukprot:CAMPEP_0167750862 /NCGR_PEP_ID=MMETSP0110_2-20121227/6228_1 /TAXON_ID=629695 /ORGANISM="Gymnochlora sp., Strain CCMP2014" /LENGTH=247 /DNA_ID=CAMNT_0007636233 /DNA_START=110 /DNA_END=853 /DNA_ORIENTATION=-
MSPNVETLNNVIKRRSDLLESKVCWVQDISLLPNIIPGAFDKAIISLGPKQNVSLGILIEVGRILRPGNSLIIESINKKDDINSMATKAGLTKLRDDEGSMIWQVGSGKTKETSTGKSPEQSQDKTWKLDVNAESQIDEKFKSAAIISDAKEISRSASDKSSGRRRVPCKKPPRKACKDCSCGRAEGKGEGLQEDIKVIDSSGNLIPPPKGGCGACSLGDAYRCEGCPYRGQPRFKVDGDRVVRLET